MMELYYISAVIGIIVFGIVGFLLGKRINGSGAWKQQVETLETQVAELKKGALAQADTIQSQNHEIRQLTSERDVQATNAEHYRKQISEQQNAYERQLAEVKENHGKQLEDGKALHEKQLVELRSSYEKQLADQKEAFDRQLATLREMNKQQIEDQLALIKEQMKTTSESVLKARQEELGERNKEQVGKIIDPLQKSLKDMEEALRHSKEQQQEALTRLDATIKLSMEKSASLGETADRLTRALTGEVKVQGNFGELKLK